MPDSLACHCFATCTCVEVDNPRLERDWAAWDADHDPMSNELAGASYPAPASTGPLLPDPRPVMVAPLVPPSVAGRPHLHELACVDAPSDRERREHATRYAA